MRQFGSKLKIFWEEHLIIIISLAGIVFAIIMFFFFIHNIEIFNYDSPIDSNKFADYGSLVGGILSSVFSLAGVYYVVQSIVKQEERFRLQGVEARFFELLKIHKDNVTEFRTEKVKGREVIIEYITFYNKIYAEVKGSFDNETIPQPHEQKEILIMLRIVYLILFIGDEDSFKLALKKDCIEIIENSIHFSKLDWEQKFDELIYFYKTSKPPCSIGYQSMFGHYYRHLFQTVNFINDQPSNLLSYEKKYLYVKTLRAQLSTHEQMVFFYNSLSSFGSDWERGIENENIDKRLITKYNLIANIPEGFVVGIDPSRIYKEVHYEFNGSEKTVERLKLEAGYT